MRGRSSDQVAVYEAKLAALVSILAKSALTVREIREAIGRERPTVATIHARIAALKERGYAVRGRKRRVKIEGKSGQRERAYSIDGGR